MPPLARSQASKLPWLNTPPPPARMHQAQPEQEGGQVRARREPQIALHTYTTCHIGHRISRSLAPHNAALSRLSSYLGLETCTIQHNSTNLYEPSAIFISDVHRRTCRLARQACAAGHPPPLAAAGCAESLTSSCTGYCRLPEPPAQASRHLASRHLASRHLVLCHLVPATSYSATSIRDRRHRAAADAPRPSATW